MLSLSNRRRTTLGLVCSVTIAGLFAACGGGEQVSGGDGVFGEGGSAGSSSAGTSGAGSNFGGSATTGGSAGTLNIDGGGEEVLTLAIEPGSPVLSVSGAPGSLQLSARLSSGALATANWFLDDVVLGGIDDTGLFTSPGFVAGEVGVTARVGQLEAKATLTVEVNITENLGGLSDADRAALDGGGAHDTEFKWLYPYDKTVFPRGLSAPQMQFAGAAADAMRVEVSFPGFNYVGYFSGSNPSRAVLPENIWQAATLSAGAGVDVQVKVSKLSGGEVTGPVAQSYRIAQGSLKGIIYYNTYNSPAANTGAVMRIRPGHDAEVMIGGCTVCHSVSAQGNVLVGGLSWSGETGNPTNSGSFDLTSDGTATERFRDTADGKKFSFGGLTPDGQLMISNGHPASGPVIRGLSGEMRSGLYNTANGERIAAPSFDDQVAYAVTPSFSPDGTKLAFSWHEYDPANLGKTLGVMSVDLSASPPQFGAPNPVVTGLEVIGWPSFTPDSQAVLYHEGGNYDTGNGHGGVLAQIKLVDLASQEVKALSALNGYLPDGNTYLPYGQAEEGSLNYEPNILPVPVGGYYWVVFTSRRAYGNTIAPGGTEPGGDNKWGEVSPNEIPSPRKKLWVSAIDIDFQGKVDPSHPAFYLPGQELPAGNMRAFAALEPCKADGQSCESAAECCGGFCRQTGSDDAGAPVLECVPPPSGCSNEDERCDTVADCCEAAAGQLCINNRCAVPTPR